MREVLDPATAHAAPPAVGALRRLDVAIAASLLLLVLCHVAAAWLAMGWVTAAATDLLGAGLLVAFAARRAWRGLLARLLLLGATAGVLELFTDFAGQQVAHSLHYPAAQPFLWTSPLYMPLSWLVVLTQLGYLAWRLAEGPRGLPVGWAIVLLGGVGAALIPFYEEMAYHAGWWSYTPVRTLGHTPAYVLLFEGLVVAALPVLVRHLPRLRGRDVLLRGALLGAWMPVAALAAWLVLGR